MDAPPLILEQREPRRPLRVLLRRLRLRDQRFFPLFDAHAAMCVEALGWLTQLLRDVSDPAGLVRNIEATEKRADEVVERVSAALVATLAPPFAREAILDLIGNLDDIVDLVEDAAQSLHLYQITSVTAEAQRLAELALDSGRKLALAVAGLRRLDQPRAILALCLEVDGLEAEADHVMRAAMSRLFRDENDAKQVLKLKSVYEVLESLTDKAKDVARDVRAIVLRDWGKL